MNVVNHCIVILLKQVSEMNSSIKRYRLKHQLTQKELADMIGCSHVTLSHYENGNAIPCQQTMINIMKVTNGKVMPNDIYRETLDYRDTE